MAAAGKVAIVTGCNKGIGRETVFGLAKEGATVYMACRDMARCQTTRDQIAEQTKNEMIFCRECDLADLTSVLKFAQEFRGEGQPLHILVNNAGVMCRERESTKQGLEMQFGVNHIGHFFLTNLLLDILKKSAPSRIVVVSGSLQGTGKINYDDLNSEKGKYKTMKALSQSKLATVMFANELARKLQGTGVVINSLHPGVVATEFTASIPLAKCCLNCCCVKLCVKTTIQGAKRSLYLALDPSVANVTGKYFFAGKVKSPNKLAEDEAGCSKLWQVSEEIVREKMKMSPSDELTSTVQNLCTIKEEEQS